ncbi:MAG: hypothetical protein FWH55_01535 [Oscillospiraceae bacterium]|nr:hypothetical protein [Oscillospiraceae bacterium]
MPYVSDNDKARMSTLATEWMKIANSSEMQELKEKWRDINDLKSNVPVVRTSAFALPGFVKDNELLCEDPKLRLVEKNMFGLLKQYHIIKDDMVIEPYLRIPWEIYCTELGVDVAVKYSSNNNGDELAYAFENPIRDPDDIQKLRKRRFFVDREKPLEFQEKLDTALSNAMPVKVGNISFTNGASFFQMQTVKDSFNSNKEAINSSSTGILVGNNYCGVTVELFMLLGYERLMYWLYDEPEAIHAIMAYLTEDRIALYQFLEKEQLLDFNTDNQFVGSVNYGYCSELPPVETKRPAMLKDVWGWCEAQETVVLSPEMYGEFVAPYMGRMGSMFGRVAYGCCERLDDRYDIITKEVPNVKMLCVTRWNDLKSLAEQCEGKQAFFRKLAPEYISGAKPSWESFEDDVRNTYEATRGKNTMLIFEDLYDVNHDWKRLRDAVIRAREIMKGDC